MTFYSDLAETSLELLTEFGQDVILRKIVSSPGGYNPATGVLTPDGITGSHDTIRKALPTDPPGNRIGAGYGQTKEVGTLIQDNDKWMYMDANGPAPVLSDHIILGDTEYIIIDAQVTSPGGIPIIYLLVLRA